MKKNIIYFGLLLLTFIALVNCSKGELETNQEKLLGTWISLDKSDTLYFTTKVDFYKSNGYMNYDHYDYQLFKDSIEIGYRGKMYVLVTPTMHKYQFDNNNLIIDLSNRQCYGFKTELLTYIKDK